MGFVVAVVFSAAVAIIDDAFVVTAIIVAVAVAAAVVVAVAVVTSTFQLKSTKYPQRHQNLIFQGSIFLTEIF